MLTEPVIAYGEKNLALGPLLLIVVAGLMFGQDAERGALSGQFRSLLG